MWGFGGRQEEEKRKNQKSKCNVQRLECIVYGGIAFFFFFFFLNYKTMFVLHVCFTCQHDRETHGNAFCALLGLHFLF